MEQLVGHALENKNINLESVLADDGAYDSNTSFQYLQKNTIRPAIKVRKNSTIISLKNNKIRNRDVIFQSRDFLLWEKKRKYGYRWMAKETVFSSIKRMFGEYTYTSATKFQIGKRDGNEDIALQPIWKNCIK